MRHLHPLLLLAVLAGGVVPRVLRADEEPAGLRPAPGPITLVSYTSTGQEGGIEAATDARGDFALAWVRAPLGRPGGVVEVRVFDAQARPLGPVRRLPSGTYTPIVSALAMNARGDFVVAWATFRQADNAYQLLAQRFAGGGTPRGEPLLLAETAGPLGFLIEDPTVGIDAAGNFAVAWDEGQNGLFLRRFVDGVLLPVQELDRPGTGAVFPTLAMQPDGSFVLTWLATASGPSPIEAQRFDAAGEPVGDTFVLGAGAFDATAATATAGGGFAFAWNQGLCEDPSQVCRIQARFLDRGGLPLGPEMTVATLGLTDLHPALAADPEGRVAISWQACDGEVGDLTCSIVTSVYTARGTPYLAPTSIPAELHLPGSAVIPTAYGFLCMTNRDFLGPPPYGIFGWPLALPANR